MRSRSENGTGGEYVATVKKITSNPNLFNRFKQIPAYREVLECFDKELGEKFLEKLIERDDGIYKKALESVFLEDDLGRPLKYSYTTSELPLSPTTLNYVKVASDLQILFGEDLGRVAEIGCGYGGQALAVDRLLRPTLITLFDLPPVLELVEQYLDSTILNSAYETKPLGKALPAKYDLVVSNYAWSELPAKLQRAYVDKVIKQSRRGYITMNSSPNSPRHGELSYQEIKELLPKFVTYEEVPKTSENNYIIVWGHREPDKNLFKKIEIS